MPRPIALALVFSLCAAGALVPAAAQQQPGQSARNVTGNSASALAHWQCLGTYDVTPDRMAQERTPLGQGALRVGFALVDGSLTATLERAPGIEPFRNPDGVRSFEPAVKAMSLFVVKDRLIFNSPGGAAFDLKMVRKRITGTMTPQEIPAFRDRGPGTVRLDCVN